MSKKAHVLYMEDNEGTARLLQKRLERGGYTIDIAPSGEAGLELCGAQPYDAIIVDYNMPGLNGMQVIERLAADGLRSPSIMLTGAGNERIAVEALKLGAVDYVIKDIDGVYLELLPSVIDQAVKNQNLLEDKRHAEEALRESEERFRMLFEHAPDPYFVSDLAGILIDYNHAGEQLIGDYQEKLVGMHFTQLPFLSQDQVGKLAALPTQVPATGPIEMAITRPDGESRVVDLSMMPIKINGQNQMLGIGHDITWRKQAEAQMTVHIERLETLSQIDDNLTRKLDIQYVQTMALQSMMDLSNASVGSIALVNDDKSLRIHSKGYPESLNHQYSLENRSISARVAMRREAEWVKNVAADPDYFCVCAETCSQITIPLLSQSHLVGVVNLETDRPERFSAELFEFLKLIAARIAVAIDNARLYDNSQKHLIEVQNLYEQISKLEQLKTEMIRIASHDLRNPLSVISATVYTLRKTGWDQLTESQQAKINAIERAAKQMASITSDFLSLERIEEITQGKSSEEAFDLRDVVQSVVESFHHQAQEKRQDYDFLNTEVPVLIRSGKAEIHQVIANLIGNAVKYTPDGGSIAVILQLKDSRARFEVIDTGYGIPQLQQDKLFQPFFRAKTKETASIEGTGLGLYLVKKIVERNGGQIIFHSEHGKGSTFGFELPLLTD